MIGPIEKIFSKKCFETPKLNNEEHLDLKSLPKYICYKAALVREKSNIKKLLILSLIFFIFIFSLMLSTIYKLQTDLRKKEYILAPGVVDFTPVSPQSVTDEYVEKAIIDFVLDFGNITPDSIESQITNIHSFMGKKQKVQFLLDVSPWIEQVKSENISQLFTITDKEILTDDSGNFHASILGRADLYTEGEYLGFEDISIKIRLTLAPPVNGKKWYLQIEDFKWKQVNNIEKEGAYGKQAK